MTPRRPHRRTPRLLVPSLLAATALLVAAAPGSADARVRVSDNWELRPDGNPIHGRDALGMAVNPRNSRHIVAVYADWANLWCEAAVSFDGGRKWRRDRLKAPAGFVDPPCTVGGHLSSQLGGTIAFGKDGNVYTAFASARVNAQGIEEARTVLVSRSTDGGRNFRTGTIAIAGGDDPDVGPDHVIPKLVVEPGRAGRADRVHLVAGRRSTAPGARAAEDDIAFTSSQDGGRTWAPARVIDGPGSAIEPSQPVVGRDGRLYVAWRTRKAGPRPGAYRPEGTVVIARSADRGATWRLRGVAGVRGFVYEGPREAPFATVQTYTNSTFPRLAADPKTADVYLVYNNGGRPVAPDEFRSADHFIHPDADVWFQRSPNHGEDWSRAEQLNVPTALTSEITQTRQPIVAVAPNGRVDVVWNDRRHWYRGCTHTHNPCLETRLGDTYYRYSSDRGRTFGAERRITDRSMNLDVGYDYRFGTYWEYAPAIVHQGSRRLLVGWVDTRNGNFETDTQSLFLARVDHRAGDGIPRRRIRGSRTARLANALSRSAYPAGPEAVLGGTFASRPWSRVVIVSEDDAPAALAGGVLARANIAPVLVGSERGLDTETRDELTRLAPVGAYVVGSKRALSDQVVEDLVATGIPREQIERIEGTSRADTARRIALVTDRRTVAERERRHPAFDAAVLVNPLDDEGYAAAILAAARRLPVLFATRTSVPVATREALSALGIRKVLVAGGQSAIADAAVSDLPGVQRLSGRTAESTSRAVAAESRRRSVAHTTVFAAPRRMDAALTGAAGARIGGLLLMAGPAKAERAVRGMTLAGEVDRIVHVTSR